MEVGAPASGIEVAHGANALTPRHGDLEAGIWARGSFPPAAPVVYLVWARTAALRHLRSTARTSTLLNKHFSLVFLDTARPKLKPLPRLYAVPYTCRRGYVDMIHLR
jgi:hypothetical protein